MKITKTTVILLGLAVARIATADTAWVIDSQREWMDAVADQSNLEIKDGLASPTSSTAEFRSTLKSFEQARSAQSITIEQSPVWLNWVPTSNIGTASMRGAPVLLNLGTDNYWMFSIYRGKRKQATEPEAATLEGFESPLFSLGVAHEFHTENGLKSKTGGYHAWQSRDMVNWVHHGKVANSSTVTSAEAVDGKVYIYYDFPNDQDPHLVIDHDLYDGLVGEEMGMAFKDPSDGSDAAIFRDLDGKFHLILEDWSPIDASTHGWDSPLAMHAVSDDGIKDFKILAPPVDERTTPTGRFGEYPHRNWHASDPENYAAKPAPVDVPQHRIKAGDMIAFGRYEIHEPEQNAYGDWAAIAIGGQHYLFGDYDPATSHGNDSMSVGWFSAFSIDGPFEWCGHIGQGHPDPDIMFAKGQFYLATQTASDFVSPGPWVATVEARVGVDVDNDSEVDEWSQWQVVKETYDAIPGFAKQVSKTPAELDLSDLPAGYGFQFELRLTDTTENASKPIIDQVELSFD